MADSRPQIHTLGELKESGYTYRSVKDEMRDNLRELIRRGGDLFPGIVGYEHTVVPAMQNAILSRHNIILLGLRGQAKTRIARSLTALLDTWTPVIAGSPLNCHPFEPLCAYSRHRLQEEGDETRIEWRPREARYQEKLATPDVSMADLIGDIDPIKAAREKRDLTDEEVISYGIVPRSNRGIFTINELPDLQSRIQVGLLNILEENDLQIRGFPIRIPMDMVLVFTANPEDYTNRGNIITPLKDRIDSQILTHYPKSVAESAKITLQEAWLDRQGAAPSIPEFYQEIIESVAFVARESEYVDKASGVSARLTISLMENAISNIERRQLLTGEDDLVPRVSDLIAAVPAITGKIELAYEGEREGLNLVALNLVGRAIKRVFRERFPRIQQDDEAMATEDPVFGRVIGFFNGNSLELSDESPLGEHLESLRQVPSLETIAKQHLNPSSDAELALAMEFVVEGLHHEDLIAKEDLHGQQRYASMLATLLG